MGRKRSQHMSSSNLKFDIKCDLTSYEFRYHGSENSEFKSSKSDAKRPDRPINIYTLRCCAWIWFACPPNSPPHGWCPSNMVGSRYNSQYLYIYLLFHASSAIDGSQPDCHHSLDMLVTFKAVRSGSTYVIRWVYKRADWRMFRYKQLSRQWFGGNSNFCRLYCPSDYLAKQRRSEPRMM